MVLRSGSGINMMSPFDSVTFGNTLSLRVDGDTGSMSLAPNGRDAVLAGRRGLYVIDLDDPFSEPRWLHHVTSWEVADVQWSPHKSKPSWCISTSNQKAMVWNLARSSDDAIEHVLHGHSRAVTDINFHPKDPELLALCSVDTFVSVWDLRRPRRPVVQLADWRAGASQVKWNYLNQYTLASSHDNYFYIWDIRKGAIPVHKIDAHSRRINGLDFGRLYESEIITCSHDMSVKFWDYNKSTETPTFTIKTDFPVNRARHLPFGKSTCGIMPTAGGNNSVYIANYENQEGVSKLKPSYIFKGHSEPVKDFLWRQRYTPESDVDDHEYQLVTWSKDRDLRLWPLAEDFYEKAGFKRKQSLKDEEKLPTYDYVTYREEPLREVGNDEDEILNAIAQSTQAGNFVSHRLNTTGNKSEGFGGEAVSNNQLNWISGVKIGRSAIGASNSRNIFEGGDDGNSQIANFGEEVSMVGHKFPKIRFEKISVSTGRLILSLMGPWLPESSEEHKDNLVFLRIEAAFPKEYPASVDSPVFKIEENHDLSKERIQEITKGLRDITSKYCEHQKFCLEPCLRYLMGEAIDLNSNFDDDALMLDPYEIPSKDEEDYELSESSDATMLTSSDSEDELIPARQTTSGEIYGDRTDHGFDSTPVPKGCGGIWTPSGHLVCFFIPETAKPKTALLKFDQQGFGLTGALARTKKTAAKSKKMSRLEDSDSDESTTDESSDDSFSNDWDDVLDEGAPRISKFLKSTLGMRQYSLGQKRASSGKNLSVPTALSAATHSTDGLRPKGATRLKNIVRIHDFRHLIPSKMELAFEYRILGDTPDQLALHNSLVAEKYGYQTLSECWKLLSVILKRDMEPDNNSIVLPDGFPTQQGTQRFYWGSHPFGGRGLAKKLFDYFELRQDVQMLAMLSCILFENKNNKLDTHTAIHVPYKKDSIHHRAAVSFSISDASAALPENLRLIPGPRMNSVASSMSSFEQKSFKGSSPDRFNSYFKKQISPYSVHRESISDNSVMTPGRTSYFQIPSSLSLKEERKQSYQSMAGLSHHSRMSSAISVALLPQQEQQAALIKESIPEVPSVKVEIIDEKTLDLFDDVHTMTMTDLIDDFKLRRYREEYAALLYDWGLHASRVKILKFNYPSTGTEASPAESDYNMHRVHINASENAVESIEPDDPLFNTSGTKTEVCNYCGLLVNKRLFVCSKCSHVLHSHCATEWWTKFKETECPSGCGCQCL